MIGERVRQLRKNVLKLTQEEFGKRIGIRKNSVSQIESGINGLTDQMCRSICREFGVSEVWLRTGEGEMLVAAPSDELDALAKRYHLRHKEYVMIEQLVNLSLEDRDTVYRFMERVVSGATDCGADPNAFVYPDASHSAPVAPAKSPQEMTDEELHAELDRQLAIEKKQAAVS